jgi:hypothetical protein
MSNALAVASVTAVLKDLLDNALIDHSVSAAVGGPVVVTALAPDRIKTGDEEIPQLNLFLYHVTPNAGWRNAGLPSRDARGDRLSNAPLAIDLHYLLTAYGKRDFEAEILLGYAMQMLHETPILSREAIRRTLAPPSPVEGSLLPPALGALAASDLADQVELIKLSPESMNTEEISKLWTALQAKYRPSVVYHASVVLIEARRPARSPLPVLTRGRPDPVTGREEGVISQPSLLPPFPTLQEVILSNAQLAIRMGETLSASGHHLDADQVTVRFASLRSSQSLGLAAAPGATSTGFRVQLPIDPPPGPVAADSPQNPDNWPAGIYTVAGVIKRAGQPDRVTNELPVTLAPRITSIFASAAAGVVTLAVTCSPKVWNTQRVSLAVSDREIAAEPISVDKTASLTFKASGLPSGQQWVRLRVDGVDSLLIDRSVMPPAFDASQRVTIP